MHFNILGCVITSVKHAWKHSIFKHGMTEVLGEWRNRKLMLVWTSHLTLWLSVALLEMTNFYYWSKYSLCGCMCVSSHKFPVHDTEFLHLKLLKQNSSMDVWNSTLDQKEHNILHCHFVHVQVWNQPSLNLHTELYTHCSPQPGNEPQRAHVRVLASLGRHKLLPVGLRGRKRLKRERAEWHRLLASSFTRPMSSHSNEAEQKLAGLRCALSR